MLSIPSNSQRFWEYWRKHRVAGIAVSHVVVLTVLILALLSSAFGSALLDTFAAVPCSSGDRTHVVRSGDTLGAIAARYGTNWQKLASYNKLANANLIFINQHICVPGGGGGTVTSKPIPVSMGIQGRGNFFPYGQCTWWASQRVFQMTGVYVPWTINANAWQWVARAYDFGWKVSGTPTVGSIVVLQPWVQGASGLGHVAVVERVLNNGYVVASNMNWGPYYSQVSNVQFRAGPGVSFVSVK